MGSEMPREFSPRQPGGGVASQDKMDGQGCYYGPGGFRCPLGPSPNK